MTHWLGWVETLAEDHALVKVYDYLTGQEKECVLDLTPEMRKKLILGVYFDLKVVEEDGTRQYVIDTDAVNWYANLLRIR